MTTGKTIALTIWTFVSKVMSLLFNMLSRFVITFLPRSKRLQFHGCSHHPQWFWSSRKCLSVFPLFPHLFAMKWWDGPLQFSPIQLLSRVLLFATPWIAACQASLSHHQFPEFTQTHVLRVGDAIQPSHPLSSPSPPAPNPSQHQSLFQWVNYSHEVAKVPEFQLSFLPKKSQGWSPSEWTGWISLQSKGLSRVFSNTTFQKHQFFSAELSL